MATSPPAVDGPAASSDPTRDSVVDALLQLYREGNLTPSVAEVAERCSVSHRTVLRYFDDLDDLARTAVARDMARVAHLLAIPGVGEGPLAARIDAIVAQRLTLFDELAPTARAARLQAPTQPVIAETLAVARRNLKDQVSRQFGPEQAQRPDEVLAAADVLLSFESVELLGTDPDGVDRASVLRLALHQLLG